MLPYLHTSPGLRNREAVWGDVTLSLQTLRCMSAAHPSTEVGTCLGGLPFKDPALVTLQPPDPGATVQRALAAVAGGLTLNVSWLIALWKEEPPFKPHSSTYCSRHG